jgi:hypothetical protein
MKARVGPLGAAKGAYLGSKAKTRRAVRLPLTQGATGWGATRRAATARTGRGKSHCMHSSIIVNIATTIWICFSL